MISTLADLLHPHDPDLLVAAAANSDRLLLRTGQAAAFARLLPWSRLNGLITADRILSGAIRPIRKGRDLPIEMMVVRPPGGDRPPVLQVDTLQSLCRQGLSLAINHIDRLVGDIGLMNAVVERCFRAPVHTNAYVSFNRDSAFVPHWDDHNVLILQVHGRKHWRCYGQRKPHPVKRPEFEVPRDLGEPEWDGVLEPGDVLYVPRGDIHFASVPDGGDSVHLTVTIESPRAGLLARVLGEMCEREPIGRRDLPALAPAPDRAAWMSDMKALLHRAVDELDLERVLDDLDRAREPLPVLSLGLSRRVSGATRLQPALRRRVDLAARDDGEVTVIAGSKRWRIPPLEARVLTAALRHDIVCVDDLISGLAPVPADAIVEAVASLATKSLIVLLGEAGP